MCFYWVIENGKNCECDGLGNPIPYKMMFTSATQVKTVGEDVQYPFLDI